MAAQCIILFIFFKSFYLVTSYGCEYLILGWMKFKFLTVVIYYKINLYTMYNNQFNISFDSILIIYKFPY